MKVNVASIIREHWSTLYDANSNRIKWSDIFVFYVLPAAAGFLAWVVHLSVKADAYNVSITFFGIFLALLLNIQVAIFGIFQRRWDIPSDERSADLQREALVERRKLLTELNSNISYLIVVSSFSLVAFLIFYVCDMTEGAGPGAGVSLYLHFVLTFLMIVKRSHALFQKEYEDSPP